MTDGLDQTARDKAQQALDEIQGHENLCAERYLNINATLGTIKAILGWAGTTIFGLLMITLGWLIVQQVNHNSEDKALLTAQIKLLEQQMRPVNTSGSTAQ